MLSLVYIYIYIYITHSGQEIKKCKDMVSKYDTPESKIDTSAAEKVLALAKSTVGEAVLLSALSKPAVNIVEIKRNVAWIQKQNVKASTLHGAILAAAQSAARPAKDSNARAHLDRLSAWSFFSSAWSLFYTRLLSTVYTEGLGLTPGSVAR